MPLWGEGAVQELVWKAWLCFAIPCELCSIDEQARRAAGALSMKGVKNKQPHSKFLRPLVQHFSNKDDTDLRRLHVFDCLSGWRHDVVQPMGSDNCTAMKMSRSNPGL